MFTVQQGIIQFPGTHLPALTYPVLEAWPWGPEWLGVVFLVDRYPTHKGEPGFHHYEGVLHAGLARYHYCLMGDTVLILPNAKHRARVAKEVCRIHFPWDATWHDGREPDRTQVVQPVLGDRPLQVGVHTA